MSLWIIGFAIAVSLGLVLLVTKSIKDQASNGQDKTLYETSVKAIVTDIQTKQDWKYGEGWYRNAWDANLTRQKIWQTYYVITAQWIHPQTKQMHFLRWAVWSDNMPQKPMIGDIIVVAIDLDNPVVDSHLQFDQSKVLRANSHISVLGQH